jgi:hypothetical protein
MAKPSRRFKYKCKKSTIFKLPRDAPKTELAILCGVCGEITQEKKVLADTKDRFFCTWICPNGHHTNREFKRFKPRN